MPAPTPAVDTPNPAVVIDTWAKVATITGALVAAALAWNTLTIAPLASRVDRVEVALMASERTRAQERAETVQRLAALETQSRGQTLILERIERKLDRRHQ